MNRPICVHGFPRSGNHLLASLIYETWGIGGSRKKVDPEIRSIFYSRRAVSDYIPWGALLDDGIHNYPQQVRSKDPGRIHLYIYRNPFEAIRSMFQWPEMREMSQWVQYPTFPEFLRSGILKEWISFHKSWWTCKLNMLPFCYETLVQDPLTCIQELWPFVPYEKDFPTEPIKLHLVGHQPAKRRQVVYSQEDVKWAKAQLRASELNLPMEYLE